MDSENAASDSNKPSIPLSHGMNADASFVRELCNLEIPNDVHFSPNAEQIVYSTSLIWNSYPGKNPISTIWLASTTEAKSSHPLTSGQTRDFAPTWHPNGKDIVFISDRAKPGSSSAIFILDINSSGQERAITPVQNEQPIGSFKFSPDGNSVAYLSADEKTAEQKARERNREDVQVWDQDWAYVRLRVVDLQTSQIRSLPFERHVLGFSWRSNGSHIAIVSAKTTEFEEQFISGTTISVVDKDLITVRGVCSFPNRVRDLLWAKDGKLYFFSGFAAWKEFGGEAVYAVDPNCTFPQCEHVAFGVENDAVGLIDVDGGVVAKVQHGLEDRIIDLSGRVLYGKMQGILCFDVRPSKTGHPAKIAVVTSDINRPAEVYIATSSNESTLQLSNHGKKFENQILGTCHYLTCPSFDGTVKLESIYLEPLGSAGVSRPLPTVVLIHGGPNVRLTNSFNAYYFMWTPYLLSLGFGILIPTYRGSIGRGEKFASHAIGGVGVYDYEDNIECTQQAINLGLADPTRLVVGGWSWGGLLTNLCCVRNGLHGRGWKFNAAISGANMCDIDSMALTSDIGATYHPELHEGGVIWNMDIDDIRCRRGSALWQFKEAMERSKKEGIDIVPPVLILHGEADARTPVSQAMGLRRALRSYSLPFEMAIYPRQGHFFHEQNFLVDMAVRVGRWCEKYTSNVRNGVP